MCDNSENNNLIELRNEIDSIDIQILELLKKRFETAVKIADEKKNLSKEIIDIHREKDLIKNLEEKNLIEPSIVKLLWTEIIKISRCIQIEHTHKFRTR
jgi:chorismate mutase